MLRFGRCEDYKRIVQMMRYQDNSYINKTLLKKDLLDGSLYLIEEDKKIKAVCSLVYDKEFKMYYIKRLFVSKQVLGQGYGKKILSRVVSLSPQGVAVTPFLNNTKMIKILTDLGFEFQYSFLTNYALYFKK